jgi:hypothetical protein
VRWPSPRRGETYSTRPSSLSRGVSARTIAWIPRKLDFERLQLAPLVALSTHLPLPDRLRADLARFAPRGTLTHGKLRWSGTADAPTSFSMAAEFAELGLVAQDAFPGTSGLAGRFEATNEGGEIRVDSSSATLDLPRVLRRRSRSTRCTAAIKWEQHDGATRVKIERLDIGNADITGDVTGTYRTLPTGPGEIDIVARASRGSARRLTATCRDRSIKPPAVGSARRSSAATRSMRSFGSPAISPTFRSPTARAASSRSPRKAKGVKLALRAGWPAIDAIDADVKIDGSRLLIDATRARWSDVEIGKTHVEIPDFAAHAPMLQIDGEAAGPIAGFFATSTRVPSRRASGRSRAMPRPSEVASFSQDRSSAHTARRYEGDRGIRLYRCPVAYSRGASADEGRRQAVVSRSRSERA